MKKIIILLLSLFLLASCLTYTKADGLSKIVIPEPADQIETKYSVIKAKEEQLAALEAEKDKIQKQIEEQELARLRKIEEQERLKQIEENRIKTEEAKKKNEFASKFIKYVEKNDFPKDLSQIQFPHIFLPNNLQTLLDDDFTKLDILFLPLQNEELSEEEINTLVNSTKDINTSFIISTGSTENLVNFANGINRDSVLLSGGMIISNLQILDSDGYTAKYKLSETKDIEVGVLSLVDDMIKAENLDLDAYKEYISQTTKPLAEVTTFVTEFEDNEKIFALSSNEPSTLDWTIFTPIDYRDNHVWPISDLLLQEWQDTYRSTHFSSEVDLGITLETSSISERMDFLYTQNIMNVSSDTINIVPLNEKGIKPLIATYIIP